MPYLSGHTTQENASCHILQVSHLSYLQQCKLVGGTSMFMNVPFSQPVRRQIDA